MATTVAHGLVGIMLYCAVRSQLSTPNKPPLNFGVLVMAALVANVPDLDMIVSLLIYGDHKVLHGWLTHTLLFVLVGGFVVWIFANKYAGRIVLSSFVALMLASHALVDFFTGRTLGVHSAHGMALLWPLIEAQVHAPITLFKGVEHSNILPGALITAVWEFVLLFPIAALTVYLSLKQTPPTSSDWLAKIFYCIRNKINSR